MPDAERPKYTSVRQFLISLFDERLVDPAKYDPDIVDLVRQHLCQNTIQSKAGNNLAKSLIELAKTRSKGPTT